MNKLTGNLVAENRAYWLSGSARVSCLPASDLFYQEQLKDRQQDKLLAFLFKHMFGFGFLAFHPPQFQKDQCVCDKGSNALSIQILLWGQDTNKSLHSH